MNRQLSYGYVTLTFPHHFPSALFSCASRQKANKRGAPSTFLKTSFTGTFNRNQHIFVCATETHSQLWFYMYSPAVFAEQYQKLKWLIECVTSLHSRRPFWFCGDAVKTVLGFGVCWSRRGGRIEEPLTVIIFRGHLRTFLETKQLFQGRQTTVNDWHWSTVLCSTDIIHGFQVERMVCSLSLSPLRFLPHQHLLDEWTE